MMKNVNRKIINHSILFIIFMLLFRPVLQAQTVSKVGTTAGAFLKIGVGARCLAMGEAMATQATDITAMYWNPAGLSRISGMQILLNHYDYIADMNFDYGALAIPMQQLGTFGIHFSILSMSDIERTTILEPEGTGEMVAASFYSIGAGYARALTDRFSIGGNLKYVSENLWHTHSGGIAMDVGVLYRSLFKNIRIGMSISNFGSEMQLSGRDLLVQHDIDEQSNGNNANINANMSTDEFSLPIHFRVGISANLTKDFLNINNNDLVIAVDAVHPNDNKEYLNIGGEYVFRDLISARAGYRQLFLEDHEGGITYGFGLKLKILANQFYMDYAVVDLGRLDYLNKISLILSF